ncbi:phosphate acyltransferase PlsX [Rufibacter immobilis]|uniref:Phosphate acyltransferase n=1 Tax=Rufibacter immobilis TaxID=1348778 RepID=A0A3M9MRF4_9BACT|nr:phosphate acyltransferase PlsX [Rufibacter immobilis]RNI28100.1 phosphate acyltransferase PlsX [Rufibacter immobilis]
MKIALDAMGGDFAPDAVVEGALLAAETLKDGFEIFLIGDENTIHSLLQKHGYTGSRVKVVHASQVIGMGEHPTKALTQKPDSSIAVGYGMLASKKVDAFCSAGNTGAMLVGAVFSVKQVEGILRPALASFIPKLSGGLGVLLDVGAIADCKPEILEQFGEIGSICAENILDIKNPRIGLMNLGEEEGKGTMVTQPAHKLLKENKSINFIGNIEGRDLFNDKADVIVCDGFTGNVILKMAESIYDILLEKKIKDPFFDRFNYEAVGGSPILGVNGNAVIGHGVSSPTAICNMLHLANKMAESHISDKLKKYFSA